MHPLPVTTVRSSTWIITNPQDPKWNFICMFLALFISDASSSTLYTIKSFGRWIGVSNKHSFEAWQLVYMSKELIQVSGQRMCRTSLTTPHISWPHSIWESAFAWSHLIFNPFLKIVVAFCNWWEEFLTPSLFESNTLQEKIFMFRVGVKQNHFLVVFFY